MPLNPSIFLAFLSRHYRPVAAICARHGKFTSDEEIVAFLRPHLPEETNPARLLAQMKDVGILVPGTEDWSPPSFLVRFLDELQNRHALASPQVIQGWIATLQQHLQQLERLLDATPAGLAGLNGEATAFLLEEIDQTFRSIAHTVHSNCDRIAAEVAAYRALDDARHMRNRLQRLILLHDQYLQPVIRIIDVSGEFQSVTDRISGCCHRLAILAEVVEDPLGDTARQVQQEVTWLRRSIIQRAEEAKRELGPLCEAAVRESRIALGVSRALEAIGRGRWADLELPRRLPVVEERGTTLWADALIVQCLRRTTNIHEELPPQLPSDLPLSLEGHWSAGMLIAELEQLEQTEDLLGWLTSRCPGIRADMAINLLQAIVEAQPQRTSAADRSDYGFEGVCVDAARWQWRMDHEAK